MLRTALLLAAAFALTASALSARAQVSPAPSGEATMVAQKVIQKAGHPCPLVVAATRLGDGSIKALCNNGETYRVFAFSGSNMALRCSAAEKLGVGGC